MRRSASSSLYPAALMRGSPLRILTTPNDDKPPADQQTDQQAAGAGDLGENRQPWIGRMAYSARAAFAVALLWLMKSSISAVIAGIVATSRLISLSWKALISKSAPSSVSALRRRRTISISPNL